VAEAPAAEAAPLQVVATAGHVDHGKSSLIVRLTGMDPDRWVEEKRRGLTIDLGFAWCTLPSGREVGFVDVPGHERFVRNMLAGVGPVRLVLFVVAADEGWKPQSEEHLAIVDVLAATGAVVALTKADLVDDATLAGREQEVRRHLAGTALEAAPMVACSAATGRGLEDLAAALDALVAEAPPPEDRGRPRIAIDRSFTIRGAGTVVTGTLTGGTLSVGDEVRLYPDGGVVRVRSLQTHRQPVPVARPVSRVAANLAGVPKTDVERGDVLALPRQWRPTSQLEVGVVPIRGLDHPLTARGAYKLYLGSAERDVRLRLYGVPELRPGGKAYARLRLTHPVVADVGDRFVLREAGRQETVAGGTVLDPDPPSRPGPDPQARLAAREAGGPEGLASLVVAEREAVRATDLPLLVGSDPTAVEGAERVGPWWVSQSTLDALTDSARRSLERFHREHPMKQGLDGAEVRRVLMAVRPGLAPALERGLAAEILSALERDGVLARQGSVLRLAGHQVTLGDREAEASRLVDAVEAGEPAPPTVRDLAAAGFPAELVDACVATDRLMRISDDLVLTPGFAARAEAVARSEASNPDGLTVSRYRELLGTSRKFALPILAWLDDRGITRRYGDVRRLR
jgi:selenocysteine-specific elongation factor